VLVFFVHFVANSVLLFEVQFGNPTSALLAIMNSSSCCSALYLTSAIGYALEGDFLACSVQATYSALFMSVVLQVKEKRKSAMKLTGKAAAGFIAAGLVQYAAVFGGSRRLIDGYRYVIPLDILTAFGTGAVAASICLFSRLLLSRSVSSAKALVAADHQAYDAAWAVCVENDDVGHIETFIASYWQCWLRGAELPRQRIQAADPFAQALYIECLEQLLGQAAVLMAFLRTKAKGWALRSKGRFPVLLGDDAGASGCGGGIVFELWEDIIREEGMARRVKWPKIKSTKRALEKVYRCYAGELARLLDCCRYAARALSTETPPCSDRMRCAAV
jgi:hypothetical protein